MMLIVEKFLVDNKCYYNKDSFLIEYKNMFFVDRIITMIYISLAYIRFNLCRKYYLCTIFIMGMIKK